MFSVPVMRKCPRCDLVLPSTQFWSWPHERLKRGVLMRDGICNHCRRKEGKTQKDIYEFLLDRLNYGVYGDELVVE